MKLFDQTLGMTPIDEATKWFSEHPFTISLWGILTGSLSKLMQITPNTNMIVSSLADVTLVLSFSLVVINIAIKGKEFATTYFPTLVKKLKTKRRTKK